MSPDPQDWADWEPTKDAEDGWGHCRALPGAATDPARRGSPPLTLFDSPGLSESRQPLGLRGAPKGTAESALPVFLSFPTGFSSKSCLRAPGGR